MNGYTILGLDFDPMAFLDPRVTISEYKRLERAPREQQETDASTTADKDAVNAIYMLAVESVMQSPKVPDLARTANAAIDRANAAGTAPNVLAKKRLAAIEEVVAQANKDRQSATTANQEELRSLRLLASQIVQRAITTGEPIPSVAVPENYTAAPTTTTNTERPKAPPPDRATLLRQRANQAQAEYNRLKASQQRTKVHGEEVAMSGYVILGNNQEEVGQFDFASLFSAAGQGVQRVVDAKSASDAAKKTSAENEAQIQAAVAADQRAKDALGRALVSEENKSLSASADRMAANMAMQSMDEAARGISPEGQKRRAESARKAVENATAEWQKASSEDRSAGTIKASAGTIKAKELWVQAAQQIYTKVQNALLVQAAQVPGGMVQMQQVQPGSQSWLSRRAVGPIPGWGVLAGAAAAVATVAVIILKKKARVAV